METQPVTINVASTSATGLQDSMESCNFCSEKAKYKCPKCNAPYCCVSCYKCNDHLKCSENFYKGLVQDELKNIVAGDESKKKITKALHELEGNVDKGLPYDQNVEEDDDDCGDFRDSEDDMAVRLKGVDLDDSDAVWRKLSQCEQQDFLDKIKSGDTSDMIPLWEPWWEPKKLVHEVDNPKDIDNPAFMEHCPPVVNCPLLSSIMKSDPSPCVPFDILNVLAAYVWVVAIFNGDHQDDCIDATEALLTLSPVLSRAANYESAEIAVNTPYMESENYSWLRESEEFNDNIKKNLVMVLTGPSASFSSYYVAAALSDIHTLLNTWKASTKSKSKSKSKGVFTSSFDDAISGIEKKFSSKEVIIKCIKKIEFYLSYIREYPQNICKI